MGIASENLNVCDDVVCTLGNHEWVTVDSSSGLSSNQMKRSVGLDARVWKGDPVTDQGVLIPLYLLGYVLL